MDMGHAQSGLLFLVLTGGYFLTLAGSGLVNSRLGHRRTIVFSALLVGGAMVFVGLSRGLTMFIASLFILGLGAGFYLPSAIPLITELIEQRNWGKALAVHEMAPNISLLAAPLAAELMLFLGSWHVIPIVLGFFSLAAGAVFYKFAPGGDFRGEPPRLAVIRSILAKPSLWILVILFSLGVGASIGVYNMLTLHLINSGSLSRTAANSLLSVSRFTGLFMTFVAGWVSDRFGVRRSMTWILFLSGVSTVLIGFTNGTPLVIFVFLQGMLAACFFPPALTALARISSAGERNMAVACTIPLGFMIGGGVIPAFIGHMGEHFTFSAGLATVGLFISCGAFLARHLVFYQEAG